MPGAGKVEKAEKAENVGTVGRDKAGHRFRYHRELTWPEPALDL